MLQAFALATSATRSAPFLLRTAVCFDAHASRSTLGINTALTGPLERAAAYNRVHARTPTRGNSLSAPTAIKDAEAQRTIGMLVGVGDIYDGIAVSPEHLPDDPGEFSDRLITSLQVGVGAFVFDKTNQKVLMVQEKNGPLKGSGVWKMPTGLLLAREDIGTAAEREVLEETGVSASFKSVLAIRQAHTALWNKSDMFIVLALEPRAGQTDILIQKDELEGAEWQTLEQFENSPFQKQFPLLARIQERCAAYARGAYKGLDAVKFPHRNSEQLLVFGSEGCEESAKL